MAFKIESSLLDACALAILSRGDTYGYEITQSMKQAIVVSESTLYPVLRRLQKENFCQTYDEPYQGRNRRYYSITEEGRAKLEEYKLQWIDYKTAIETFLGDAGNPAGQTAAGTDNSGAAKDAPADNGMSTGQVDAGRSSAGNSPASTSTGQSDSSQSGAGNGSGQSSTDNSTAAAGSENQENLGGEEDE